MVIDNFLCTMTTDNFCFDFCNCRPALITSVTLIGTTHYARKLITALYIVYDLLCTGIMTCRAVIKIKKKIIH